MSNKKILKEEITPEAEKRQQLMSLSVGVEEAVLKLYKFAVTDQNVDQGLVTVINKLKSHVSEFTHAVDKRESESEQEENDVIDLNQPTEENKKDFIESEEQEEDKDVITENKKISLKEHKIWKCSIDLKKEMKLFFEAYSIYGFENKQTKNCLSKLTEALRTKVEILKETFGVEQSTFFEESIEDMATSENEQEFEECYERMTEWANKENKLFIKY